MPGVEAAMMSNPASLTIGGVLGGLNSFMSYQQRQQQRGQFNKAIDAERAYRNQLQQSKDDLMNDTRSGLTDALVAATTTRNPNTAALMKSAYDNTSAIGRQGMREYDKSIADSTRMEQQLGSQKPGKYGVGDFFSDFIGGGIKGYQATESFMANNQSREDAGMFRKESMDQMKAWTNSLKLSTAGANKLMQEDDWRRQMSTNTLGWKQQYNSQPLFNDIQEGIYQDPSFTRSNY